MLALMLAAFLTSPHPPPVADPDCSRFCLGVCKWNPREMWCDDTRVQRLGSWDPIPLDYYWSDPYLSPPPDFGAYPTEQQPDQSYTPGPPPSLPDFSDAHGWGP